MKIFIKKIEKHLKYIFNYQNVYLYLLRTKRRHDKEN